MIGEQVAAQAREWRDVPFHWGQASRHGCDCKGLIAGVADELGLPEAKSLYAQMRGYGRKVDSALLMKGLAEVFDRVPKDGPYLPGDVLVLTLGDKPRHLVMVLDAENVIGALEGETGQPRVRETSLRLLKRLFRVHSAWRWRAV